MWHCALPSWELGPVLCERRALTISFMLLKMVDDLADVSGVYNTVSSPCFLPAILGITQSWTTGELWPS